MFTLVLSVNSDSHSILEMVFLDNYTCSLGFVLSQLEAYVNGYSVFLSVCIYCLCLSIYRTV